MKNSLLKTKRDIKEPVRLFSFQPDGLKAKVQVLKATKLHFNFMRSLGYQKQDV